MKLAFASIFSALLLTGCANIANPVESTKQWYSNLKVSLDKPRLEKLHITNIQFKLHLPNQIVMQKQAYGATPIITNKDKREAALAAKAQLALLDQGLRTKFQQKAEQHGLTISTMAADVLHAHVESIYSFCQVGKGCKTRLNLNMNITNIENKVVWSYSTAIEQNTPRAVVNEPMFDNFADMLLEAMRLDGLV
jgi:hypothetical protein